MVQVSQDSQYLTAFLCCFGHYEYQVMPFGLMNALATFQRFVSEIFHDLLDVTLIVYIDDLLIYSKTYEQHTNTLNDVFSRLEKKDLFGNLSKSSFYTQKVSFSGFELTPVAIRSDPEKVAALSNWKTPEARKQLQRFRGFTNYYRRFVNNFAQIAMPLYASLKNANTLSKGKT
jgi:Reverse transcriptase (RNA-dependent DNA polymerase)